MMKGMFSRLGVALLLGLISFAPADAQTTTLANQPLFAGADVPGNLALTLSVEFPTAISVANIGNYVDASTYLGYFDPAKCYNYVYNATTPSSSFFQPYSFAGGTNSHSCTGYWSGNFMNWATMQTIDPFRWVLSGGYRAVDTPSQTILEKAWGSQQGNAASNFNYRGTAGSSGNLLSTSPTNYIPLVTPFQAWPAFNMGIWGNGNMMVFSGGAGYTWSAFSSFLSFLTPVNDFSSKTGIDSLLGSLAAYRVYIRVSVCDTTIMGVAGLESNCVKYSGGYKPEGLMQKYASKIRYSALSYLNSNSQSQQGGVLREPMGFIGPTYPQPFSTTLVSNSRSEWDANTGVMNANPDTASSAASGVTQSGVMNYLNKFGEYAASIGNYNNTYMTYDHVSELYYAAVRYFENLGNVPQWTASLTPTLLDGFPAVTTWTDPIAYTCQKNFILGIGDDHTHTDYNTGGATDTSGSRSKPPLVASDTFNQSTLWTHNLQVLEGINPTPWWESDQATYYIAGLAYGVHVLDIRPDLPLAASQPPHTISTYWMDVEENGLPESLNPYYLATKYGGFSVPNTGTAYSMSNTTPLPLSEWDTNGTSITMNNGPTEPRPDNYFLAGNANLMQQGLISAFTSISNSIAPVTTSFAFSTANVTSAGTTSFASQYASNGWTGIVTAYQLVFDGSGNASQSQLWATNGTLQSQLANNGWQTARRVATWNGTTGVPFEVGNITASQMTALLPVNVGTQSATTAETKYLYWLRGDQTNEAGSTVAGSTQTLRARTLLLGDIVDASLAPVATPSQTFSESTNPGYANFLTQWTTTTPRPTMVYAAANDGMLHAFVGSTGLEQFAYIPSALFQGPNGTPQVDGLAQLGNPSYAHHYYVDATPIAFDIDFTRTNGAVSTSASSNWNTLLIGGLGKGGKSFYALNVTNPAAATTETAAAGLVAWEFTDSTMGYSFGAPIVVKTLKYGWVAAFTSGYNNSDGYGYLYLVNPSNGTLLEKIKTPSLSNGLTQASAYVQNYSDYTADSIYVGDLNGQLWRFDLTLPASVGTSTPYPAPTLIAKLADANGNAQPITTAPLIEIHPTNRKRYVMLGTGQLLASTDIVWPNQTSPSTQSFYAIIDGNAGGFSSIPTPIVRANLTQVTTSGLASGPNLPAASKGWYVDLGTDPTSGIAYRVNINPKAYNGSVSWSTILTSGDACSPSGKGQVYAVNYASATSVVQSVTTGAIIAEQDFSTPVVNLKYIGVNGSAELIAGLANGGIYKIPAVLSNAPSTRILNWREVPTVE